MLEDKYCYMDAEEYRNYILNNSTSPNYDYLAIRENTIPTSNISKSKT